MTLDRAQLIADLTVDEKFVDHVYDDANGSRVVPGYVMKGQATLATGWCPNTNPCPQDLNDIITGYWADKFTADLFAAAPWIKDQPEPVQRALINMSFNLGVHGLLEFSTFLHLVQTGRYGDAATDLSSTTWYRQVGQRGPRIQALIRQGAT